MIKKIIHRIIYAPMNVLKEASAALGVILGLYQGIAFFFPDVMDEYYREKLRPMGEQADV
jgi:hypothetical protein